MKTNLLLLLLLSPYLLPAQITGKVLDFMTDEPLIGANISLQTNKAKGTQTELDGSFILNCNLGDTLIISYIGYKIKKTAARPDRVIRLRPDAGLIQEVVVKADKLTAREFATEQLKKLDIYLNPNSRADALPAIDALPASTNTEETANISLRGSSLVETGVFLNNVPLDDVVRFDQTNGVGQFSIFNTAMIESVNVFPSNPPVEFGNAASGVVALYTDERIPEKRFSLSVSPVGLSGLGSRKITKKTGITAFANWNTHHGLQLFNPNAFNDLNSFGTLDAGIYGIHNFSRNTSLKVFNFTLSEGYNYRFRQPSFTDDYEQSKFRNLSIANLVHKAKKLRLEWNQSFNYSKADYGVGNLAIDNQSVNWFQAVQALYFTAKMSVKGGLSAKGSRAQTQGQFPVFFYAFAPEHPSENFTGDNRLFLPEAFVYTKFNLSPNWTLGGGLRALGKTDISPTVLTAQTALNYRSESGHSFTLAGGKYAKVITPNNENSTPGLLESTQVSLDYQWKKEGWTLQTAVYAKQNKTPDFDNPIAGAEVFLAYQKKNITAGLSMAHVNSILENDESSFPSRFDLSYYLRAYVKYDIPDWFTLAVIYKQRQGAYFTPIVGAVRDENLGIYAPLYAKPNEGERLPDYRLLDMRFSKIIPVSFGSLITYLNFNNILDVKNIRGYLHNSDYTDQTQEYFNPRVIFFGAVLQW